MSAESGALGRRSLLPTYALALDMLRERVYCDHFQFPSAVAALSQRSRSAKSGQLGIVVRWTTDLFKGINLVPRPRFRKKIASHSSPSRTFLKGTI